MIKIALAGAGYWGPNLARVANQSNRCELSAICDANPANLSKLSKQYPASKPHSSFEELLESDVDAIMIATPISTHYDLAKRALESGKHVFVEKPLAHTGTLAR